jgi:hypothetical protein
MEKTVQKTPNYTNPKRKIPAKKDKFYQKNPFLQKKLHQFP